MIKGKQRAMVDLISEKASSLVLEQAKVLLDSKISKMREELDYVRDRLSKITVQRDEATEVRKKLAPDVAETESVVRKLLREKDDLDSKCLELHDIEDKLTVIAERKIVIENSTRELTVLTERSDSLQQQLRDITHHQEISRERLVKESARREKLVDEISMLDEKVKTYSARTAEFADIGELKKELARARKDIKKHSEKITAGESVLKKKDKELLSVRSSSDKLLAEKDELITSRAELQDRVKELESIGDKETLSEEVDSLKTQKVRLTENTAGQISRSKSLEMELIKYETNIKKEKVFEEEGADVLEKLMEVKKEVDNAENVMKMIRLNIEVNKKFRDMIGPVTQYLGPVNDKVVSMSENHKESISELRRIIQQRLGNI